MRYSVQSTDYRKALTGAEDQIAEILTAAMGDAASGLKAELRDQVRAAGLGGRLANTWQARTYPQGRKSLDPSVYAWSKAPKLILAYDQGATILPTEGRRYLAIPTENVPLKGRGRRMTPLDVETTFNQDLIIRKSAGGHLLAFVNAVRATRGKAYRPATKGRLAKGREVKLVLMFILVRQVSVRRRLDVTRAANIWASRVPALIAARWR